MFAGYIRDNIAGEGENFPRYALFITLRVSESVSVAASRRGLRITEASTIINESTVPKYAVPESRPAKLTER